MMTQNRSIIVFLCLLMLFMASACTGQKQPADHETTVQTEASEQTTPTATEPSSGDPTERDTVEMSTAPSESAAPTESSGTTASTEEATPSVTEEAVQVYTITYIGLEGAEHSNPATYTAETAAEITLNAPAERAGYTFEGWFIGETKVTTLAGCTGDLELTAQWKENSAGGAIQLPDADF